MSTLSGHEIDRWLIFQNDQVLFIRRQNSLELPSAKDLSSINPHIIRKHLLGHFNKTEIHCADILHQHLPTNIFESLPLRSALDHLGDDWYSILTKAFTIINWDRNHQHCGRCGEPTLHKPFTFERFCTGCSITFYPRISPSIIVLIRRDDQVLMARGRHFKPGIYGLIAGFVEAGENLEDTIHREIFEETQISVKNLQYFGSQVWPFPDSLMLGFFADYHSGTLNIDNDEIEDAGWYRFDELPGRPSSNISIASKMLNHFIAEQEKNMHDDMGKSR